MKMRITSLIIGLVILFTSVVGYAAPSNQSSNNDFQKLTGFKYDTTGNKKLVNQNYNLLFNYSISENEVAMELKSNINDLKDYKTVTLSKVEENLYVKTFAENVEFVLDLTTGEPILNILVDEEAYVFSNKSRYEVVKNALEENKVKKDQNSFTTLSTSDPYIVVESSNSRIHAQAIFWQEASNRLALRVNTVGSSVLTHVTRVQIKNGVVQSPYIIKSVNPVGSNSSDFGIALDLLYYWVGKVGVFIPSFSTDSDKSSYSYNTFQFDLGGMWTAWSDLEYNSNSGDKGVVAYVYLDYVYSEAPSPTADISVTYYISATGYFTDSLRLSN